MARLAVNTATGVRTKVPTPGVAPSFVPGSRPGSLRADPVPRVKTKNTRDYGKGEATGYGLTGETSRS